MKIRCAWCRTIVGTRPPFGGRYDTEITDGICDDCLSRYFPNVREKCKGLDVSVEDRYGKLHVRRSKEGVADK